MATSRATIDPEILARLIENQERQATQELRTARTNAQQGLVKDVVDRLKRLGKFVGESKIPSDQREVIKREAIEIQRSAYRMHCDILLDEAMSYSRTGDKEARAKVLKSARDALGVALSMGVEPDFKVSFFKKVEVVMLTEPQGTSEKAHVDKHVDWEKNTKPEDLVGEKAKRRHLRYKEPPLVVVIAGKSYTTLNWSLGGLRIACDITEFSVGQVLTASFHAEPLPGISHAVKVQVVRLDEDANYAALAFPTLDNAVMELIKQLRKAGMDPA